MDRRDVLKGVTLVAGTIAATPRRRGRGAGGAEGAGRQRLVEITPPDPDCLHRRSFRRQRPSSSPGRPVAWARRRRCDWRGKAPMSSASTGSKDWARPPTAKSGQRRQERLRQRRHCRSRPRARQRSTAAAHGLRRTRRRHQQCGRHGRRLFRRPRRLRKAEAADLRADPRSHGGILEQGVPHQCARNLSDDARPACSTWSSRCAAVRSSMSGRSPG